MSKIKTYLPVIVIAVFFMVYFLLRPHAYYGDGVEPPKPVDNFTLTSGTGDVSLDSFAGKVVVLYFGYTACPDVCPTTLTTLGKAMELMGEKAKLVQVVMVSVDPERDTPARLDEYVKVFNPAFVGVTGSKEQIDAVTSANGIFYKLNKKDSTDTNYEVDHTATLLVLDKHQQLALLIPYGNTDKQIAEDLTYLIDQK